MSRFTDLLRGFGSPLRPLPSDDLSVSVTPGAHVSPSLDQAGTDRLAPYGAAGTINYDGYLQPSDYNPDLTRFQALDIYERMRRSDPSVRETLWTVKQPIINAEWAIVPPDDATEQEREISEFVRAALFDWPDQPWTEMLEHALTYLDFGHSVFETTFQIVERALTVRQPVDGQGSEDLDPQDGSGGDDVPAESEAGDLEASELPTATKNVVLAPVPLPPDTTTTVMPPRKFTTWRRFAPRLPRTIWKWNVDEFGELTHITQLVFVNQEDGTQAYQTVEIPAANLMVFTHEKWGDEWTGISLQRAAYKAWIMKELIEKIAGIAYERHGVGYIVGYMSRDRADDKAMQTAFANGIQALRSDAWSVIPGPKLMSGATGDQGYLIEILTPPGGIPDFTAILLYWRSELAGAMLARFKELGHAAVGSKATADVQAAVWYNALHAIARYLEAIFNVAIRRLVDLNYPGVKRYPTLKASGIEARNLLEFAQSVALGVDAEMLSPDTATRNWFRATIDAPPEDLAETRARMRYEAAQAAVAAAPATDQPGSGGQNQSATEKLKATLKSRGTETKDAGDSARPRPENV
jgi:hypothetical protein